MNSVIARFSCDIARISGMNHKQIIELHFSMQEEIKKQYRLRKNAENLKNAITLCEKSVSISSLVINAMKKNHRADCDEYARVTGMLSPNSKFFYPSHYAANQLCIILRKQGKINQMYDVEEKMRREGWNSGRSVDLLNL